MKKDTLSSSYLAQPVIVQKPIAFSWLRKELIIEIICCLLILLFIYSALSKLSDYDRFTVQLSKSPYITTYAALISWSIPAIEMLIALFLVIKRTRLVGLYASFFLMSLFTAYLIVMLNFSYYIPCSCGGVLENLSWNQHILFNSFFIVIAAAASIMQHKHIYA
ncbi:MauE/DoxX family redox-associated membrane protein [Longitalea arenae]|uniref:MauE/DoxX family redox-associated membrane protein n=1 Tax=Longitalea arenae TaxID=2812558 RepID=UPI0019679413|nr:MauE/DoxX family redox-associated membrane protein [Longitalea arenae]